MFDVLCPKNVWCSRLVLTYVGLNTLGILLFVCYTVGDTSIEFRTEDDDCTSPPGVITGKLRPQPLHPCLLWMVQKLNLTPLYLWVRPGYEDNCDTSSTFILHWYNKVIIGYHSVLPSKPAPRGRGSCHRLGTASTSELEEGNIHEWWCYRKDLAWRPIQNLCGLDHRQ